MYQLQTILFKGPLYKQSVEKENGMKERKRMLFILKNEYKDVRKSTNLTGIYCGLFSTQTLRRQRTQGEYIFMLKIHLELAYFGTLVKAGEKDFVKW